jgi:hypothetical protein
MSEAILAFGISLSSSAPYMSHKKRSRNGKDVHATVFTPSFTGGGSVAHIMAVAVVEVIAGVKARKLRKTTATSQKRSVEVSPF